MNDLDLRSRLALIETAGVKRIDFEFEEYDVSMYQTGKSICCTFTRMK